MLLFSVYMAMSRYCCMCICGLAHILSVYIRGGHHPLCSIRLHLILLTPSLLRKRGFCVSPISFQPSISIPCFCPGTEDWGIMWSCLTFYIGLIYMDSGSRVCAMSILNPCTVSQDFVCNTLKGSRRKNGIGYDNLLIHRGYLTV